MAPTDPHQGGRLEDMAVTGTTIPGDAGQQRLIPSVPRPDQKSPNPGYYSHTNPAHAADNAFDIPRGVEDQGSTGEVLSGTGDQITSNIEKKNLDDADKVPQAKGHDRYAKHVRKQQSEFDGNSGFVHEGHDVQRAPVEEEELLTQDELLEKRGAK
ncbi:hypothetical protein E8E13_003009 [Curvularia kusanoi]|uniref:Uncharacterized protein n=1 Tax=Curvularia kusanoi TaxID=90978 RepID=A0A9P4T469_CURKU|nr:hypothetical protein E8E13_003009 [Curvularia kusanoi]